MLNIYSLLMEWTARRLPYKKRDRRDAADTKRRRDSALSMVSVVPETGNQQ